MPDTWGSVLKEGVEKKDVDVIPYELELGYDHWSHSKTLSSQTLIILLRSNTELIGDILTSILPDELHDDIPTGFNVAGHVGKKRLSIILRVPGANPD